jgi:hypothetical protein
LLALGKTNPGNVDTPQQCRPTVLHNARVRWDGCILGSASGWPRISSERNRGGEESAGFTGEHWCVGVWVSKHLAVGFCWGCLPIYGLRYLFRKEHVLPASVGRVIDKAGIDRDSRVLSHKF